MEGQFLQVVKYGTSSVDRWDCLGYYALPKDWDTWTSVVLLDVAIVYLDEEDM